MADSSSVQIEGVEILDDAPKRRAVGGAIVRFLMFWDWEIKPKGDPKPAKWWSVWRWQFWHAPPITLKRSPVPSLGNLMIVDQRSMEILQTAANFLSVALVIANLTLMATYAAIVASHSQLPLVEDLGHFAPKFGGYTWFIGAAFKALITVLFCGVAMVLAVAFQLGTDFSIPFAAALAAEKYRVVPALLMVLWVGCAATTAIMEADVFNGWGRERLAESAETATISASDLAIMDKYRNAIPPTLAQSDAAKNAAQRDLLRLQPEYDRQVKARDGEETNRDSAGNGMGPKWRNINADVQRIGGEIETANGQLSKAEADHANRLEYDRVDQSVKASAKTVKVAERQLLYDAASVVSTRSLLATFAPVFFVLVSFMVRGARAEQAKRSNAAQKGVETKNQKKNTKEGEFEEVAPANAPRIESTALKEPGSFAPATTRTPKTTPHPDAAGDDSINGTNGYAEPLDIHGAADGQATGS